MKTVSPFHTLARVTASALLLLLGAACSGANVAAGTLTLDVRPENRRILVPGNGLGTLQIQVAAPDHPDRDHSRRRLNLSVVIDRSGSMAEARKLDYVKIAVHQLVDRLAPGDVLSIVTYDDRIQVPWPASPLGGNRETLHRIVEGIYPGSRTHLSGGLEEGFHQVAAGRRNGYLNRVLLLSDGLANVGITSRDGLRRKASDGAEGGVSVSTFGVGNEFDEELLAAVARGGGGNYHYLADPERIASALSTEFSRASRVAAVEVEILINLHSGCRFNSLVGREWSREGDAYVIRLGDLSAGERRTVFADVTIDGERLGSREVGHVSFRYRDPATEKRVTGSGSAVALELVRDEAKWREGFDASVQERGAVARSNAIVQEAARMADEGKKEKAKELLGQAAAGLSAAPPSPAVREEMERTQDYGRKLDSLGDMSSDEAKGAQKSIKYRAYEQLNQR